MNQLLVETVRKDSVVIGAGISGLVCAYRLKTLGADVLLLESSDRVGGVIVSEEIDGYLVERGPNSSQGTEELLALIAELGIMNELAEGDPKAPAYVYFRGRLHPVPSGPGAFIRSRLLSAKGKLRILEEPFVSARRSSEEESIASFARRRIGREAAERMVAPFVSGIYAGDAEKLSAQAAFPRLVNLEIGYGGLFRGMFAKAREARRARKSASAVLDKAAPTRRRLVSFKSGMGFLPKTLASKIGEDLITGIADCGLRIGGPGRGFEVAFNRDGKPHRVACDHAIIATPAGAAASLVRSWSDELSRLLEEIYYPPLAIVCLAYDESSIKTPLDGFGFLVPPGERMNVLGCVWNSSLFEGRAPEGQALVTSFIGGARNTQAARMPDAELVTLAHSDLQKVLGISSEPRVVAITRWERAIPQYNIGHAGRVRRIEELLEATAGLHLIGNYLHGVSTGDCIKEADRVAREVGRSLAVI
ncbi:MAG TPA: protoporphyrinogen oxidase [Blastocatellia bacterium]|nr:protoporphyrinogen oxidase [Blastocatellia bacterium]